MCGGVALVAKTIVDKTVKRITTEYFAEGNKEKKTKLPQNKNNTREEVLWQSKSILYVNS